MQDENKRLETSEEKARLLVNERLGSLLLDVQDVMNSKTSPRSEKLDIALDEALVPQSERYCKPF